MKRASRTLRIFLASVAVNFFVACSGDAQNAGSSGAAQQPQAAAVSGSLGNPPLPSADQLFAWAQSKYPALFPGSPATASDGPFTYRHYPQTGNYIGVTEDGLYVLGPVSSGAVQRVGARSDFSCTIAPQYCPELRHDFIPVLRGAQIGEHADWMDAASWRWAHISQFTSSGANVARLMVDQYSSETGERFAGANLKEITDVSLARWGGVIEHLLARNIHVVISLNIYSWRAGKTWPDDGRSVWSSASAQQEVIDMWSALALRYRGRPGVIFDLFNEPHGTTTAEQANDSAQVIAAWNALHPRIIAAVSAVDPDRWMMVEPLWGQTGYLGRLTPSANKKVMYQIHNYRPHFFTHQGTTGASWPAGGSVSYPGNIKDLDFSPVMLWNKAALLAELQPAATWAQANGKRVVLGETGVMRDASSADRARFVADTIEIAEQLQFGLIWFRFEGFHPATTFRIGWSYENSEAEPLLQAYFSANAQPATRVYP